MGRKPAQAKERAEDRGMGSILAAMAMSAFAFGTGAPGAPAEAAHPPQGVLSDAVKTYQIRAGSMAAALTAFADKNGMHLLYDARATRRLTSPGLVGAYSVREGLERLLAGTGLAYRLAENGTAVTILLAQAATGTQSDASPVGLPPVDVTATQGDPTGTGPGESGGRFTGYNAVDAYAATKMDTPILQTPVAIQVVPRETLDDQQAITPWDALFGNVSSVYNNSYANTDFYIRGFRDGDGRIYYNGLQIQNASNIDLANVQSFEVLKGPAAILFGRVEPGGIVWLQSKRPQEVPYYSIQEQAGSFGTTRTTLDATGPLTADKTWLYRFTADFSNTNTFQDFNYQKDLFISPVITYHPIEQFKVNVEAYYHRDTFLFGSIPGTVAQGDGVTPLPISRFLGDPALTAATPGLQQTRFLYYDWTYNINPDWTLTNRGSYLNESDFFSTTTILGFDPVTADVQRYDFWAQYSQYNLAGNIDLTGKFATGPVQHAVLLGTDYFSQQTPVFAIGNAFPTADFGSINDLNIYNPVYFPSGFSFFNPSNYIIYSSSAQQFKGVYAQDLISALDGSVHLLIGGRYDWADVGTGTGSTPAQAEVLTNIQDKAFSPRIGLVYQPQPWLSFYGNYTTSFGANNGVNAVSLQPLPPEKGLQWEGGAKAEFFDKRLSASMAFYDIFKTNIPTNDPTNPLNTIVIGEVESKGVEFDITGKITNNWSVIGNFSHEDVRVVQATNCHTYNPCVPPTPAQEERSENPVVGNWLASVPANAGNFWLKYTADGDLSGLNIAGGANIIGSSWGDNANSFQLPQYTLINGMISYRFPWQGAKITAQLNVKNLFDTAYYITANNSRYNVIAGQSRAILGSLRLEF